MQINVEAVVLSAQAVSEQDKRLVLFYARTGPPVRPGDGRVASRAKLAAATEPTVRGRFRLWLRTAPRAAG
jgi:recombinational DNA repair protein (RecF pathway)